MQTKRSSNIELLRIVAMVMIVAHHLAVHGGFIFPTQSVTLSQIWIEFLAVGGKAAVNIFVLISGYFMIESDIKPLKIVKLWAQIFSYSAAIYLVFAIFGSAPLNIREILKNVLPVTYSRWWFATTYFVLYLLSPFINAALRSFDKKMYGRLLTAMLIMWCIVPTITDRALESNRLLWFIFVYALAGYIRKYVDISAVRGKKCIGIAIGILLVTYGIIIACELIGTKIPFFGRNATHFYDMEILPILAASIMMFIGFAATEIKYSRVINTVSSAAFGVYLIHDNEYIRNWLWKNVFASEGLKSSILLVPYTLLVIAAVFVVCTVAELLRIRFFERYYLKLLEPISDFVCKIWNKINNALFGRRSDVQRTYKEK